MVNQTLRNHPDLLHPLSPKLKNKSRPSPKNLQIKGNPQGSLGANNEARTRMEEEKRHAYQVLCAKSDSDYIGETRITLEKRISEHKGAVTRHEVINGIALHAWTKQHKVDWQAATVKHVETNHTK